MDELVEEADPPVSKERILDFANRLNFILPVGQLLYFTDEGDGDAQQILGMRYAFPTGLQNDAELKKCVEMLMLLMQSYELLCSCLILFLDGDSMDSILNTIHGLLNPET